MRSAAREIREGLAEKLKTETNTLLTIDSQDRAMRELADALNVELRRLRAQRHKYEQGNLALKEAVMNVSHDIRTPLTAICGYLELLEGEEKSEAAQRYLQVIKERSEALKRLTEELFAYAVAVPAEYAECTKDMTNVSFFEGQDKPYEEVALNRVLEESIAAFYGALKTRKITPQIIMPDADIVCRGKPTALARIFENILTNVLKYSDGDLSVRLTPQGEVMFSNHAAALDEIQVGRLFDRFYTVENAEHSTGLGLSIAKLLTEQMGGSVYARYEDGMFTICLMFARVESKPYSPEE
ncbi:MAG: HAMP domain-containing histidine kinase [Lachnospiraceae bacterium]|nr:HAMP domain-containing histidine kinase [Lachnospiraceae bacterium]